MWIHEQSDCMQLLLDLISYEIHCRRLSPEMEELLEDHMESCPPCRRKLLNFEEILEDAHSH